MTFLFVLNFTFVLWLKLVLYFKLKKYVTIKGLVYICCIYIMYIYINKLLWRQLIIQTFVVYRQKNIDRLEKSLENSDSSVDVKNDDGDKVSTRKSEIIRNHIPLHYPHIINAKVYMFVSQSRQN